ncbi:MAG: sugar transferase [Planctomycetes bacterium]|nr:sugar transferase [Planctomycetota bacterium]
MIQDSRHLSTPPEVFEPADAESAAAARQSPDSAWPSIWGLDPAQLHERFWSSRGVQVVAPGRPQSLRHDAELYLLAPSRSLVLLRLRPLVDLVCWLQLKVLFAKLPSGGEDGYREIALADESSQFLGYQRIYEKPGRGAVRVALTPDERVAAAWRDAPTLYAGWERLLRQTSSGDSDTACAEGRVFDATSPPEVVEFAHELAAAWRRPGAASPRTVRWGPRVWVDAGASIDRAARIVGPVWVGAGRRVEAGESIVGPAILWDDPEALPAGDEERLALDAKRARRSFRGLPPLRIPSLPDVVAGARAVVIEESPEEVMPEEPKGYRGKRLLDIAVSLAVLTLCIPFFPLVLLAIWIEDRRPFFFIHRRETFGGKEFPCIKFRSMRRDAEEIKARLRVANQIDGPQFFMENDPRMLRVGAFLRKSNIDEIPQFFNVLLGQMSVVGPRPSPYEENQFCPAWREARLSVRPGVTGLWQVKRTRAKGLDFQEWIRYDIEYVEKISFWLDLWIVARTIQIVIVSLLRAVFSRRDGAEPAEAAAPAEIAEAAARAEIAEAAAPAASPSPSEAAEAAASADSVDVRSAPECGIDAPD